MSSFVHGIASVQVIDSSGEVVDIKGLDISSLPKTGVINYEHKSDLPAQIVGKIIKAKKIYKGTDCSNEYESYFWNKCQVPFVYVVAELLDNYTESAKEVAGILRYDSENKDKHAILGFSVEGSSIPGTKEGVTIKRSIARKISLTATPCNKLCLAELMPDQKSQIKDDLDSIFKTEENAIAMFKSGEGTKIYEEFLAKKEQDMKKSVTLRGPHIAPKHGAPNAFGSKTADPGTVLGTTKSGKPVYSHGQVNAYHGFSSADHTEAGMMHAKAAESTVGNPKLADHHNQKMKLHNQAAITATKREGRFKAGMKAKVEAAKKFKPVMVKSLTAGGMGGAPSTMVNGAAFQKENLGKKKSDLTKRAEEEYQSWSKRKEFEKFMKSKMPHLADGEIKAIGHLVALQKSLDAEKNLESLVKADKLNEPVFSNIPGKKLIPGGLKTGLGSSAMGAHVRNQTDPRSSESSKEVSKIRAKQIAEKNLKRLKEAPKPNLDKSEIHSGVHEFEGQKHHVSVNKLRSGRYNALVSPGEHPLSASGSIHTINYSHNGGDKFKVSHETPYTHVGGTNSPISSAIRKLTGEIVKEHHNKTKK